MLSKPYNTYSHICLFVCLFLHQQVWLSEFTCFIRPHILCDPRKAGNSSQLFSTHYPMPSEQLTSMRLSKSFRQSLDLSYFSLLPCLCFNILQNNLTLILQIFPIVEKNLWNSTSAQPLDT